MRRLGMLMVAVLAVLLIVQGEAMAASDKAASLRKQNGLVPFTPPEAFLAGGFTAAEMHPSYIYGPVRDFAASRSCPTAWLIEEEEKARLEKRGSEPFEYTLYLEEDCDGAVTYYVFIEQPAVTPQQWLAWRQQFHKNKTEGEYGETGRQLEKAVQDGVVPMGELRYIERNGELLPGAPESILASRLGVAPLYDLKQARKLR